MSLTYSYKPIQFFLLTFLCTWIPWFLTAYLSHQKGKEKLQLVFMFLGLAAPLIVAVGMVYASRNQEFISSFWHRLVLFKMDFRSLLLIFVGLPTALFLATAISLLFGKSPEQFSLVKEYSVMKGWQFLSLVIPIILAPALEEIGWRGYGVDSLRSHFNLFNTCMLYALLWGLWHLPLFFVQGYYHHELRSLGYVYVMNFFISIIPAAILLNWLYYTNSRSILIAIIAHAVLNALSIFFRTEQFTKCIFTGLLLILSGFVVIKDKELFFKESLPNLLKQELSLLKEKYRFPGATVSYILPSGLTGSVSIGMADKEKETAMQPHSPMLAASIGKSFVAATILQLSAEGKLHIDDKLSHWLGDRPWFSRLPNSDTITLRHLLNHTSGILDHVHQEAFFEDAKKYGGSFPKPFNPESLVAYILDKPPLSPAGETWMYTDTGYVLLGLVIEKVTANPCFQEIGKRFTYPLNLTDTYPSDKKELPHIAAGYTAENNPFGFPQKTLDKSDNMAWDPQFEWAGGGIVSTSNDLVRWAKALFEGRAMEQEYVATLLKKVPVSKEKGNLFYGTGVTITEGEVFGTTYGHLGIIPGYTSCMRYYPQYRVTLAFQVNTDVGVWDKSTDLLKAMDSRLSALVIENKDFLK